MINNKFYVYLHFRNDDGSIFYVGKGYGNRHKSLSGRNPHWKNTANKHGWFSEVVTPLMSEDDAFYAERMIIYYYRESGFKLCNIADGGEGSSGVKHTEETREKYRAAKIGKKQSPEHAAKSANAKCGKKQPANAILSTMIIRSRKVINSDGDIFFSVADAVRFLKHRYGIVASQGNISMCAAGIRSQAYGFTWSYDVSKTPRLINVKTSKKKIINETNGMIFESVTDAVNFLKSSGMSANNQCISSCARKCSGTAYGYKWRYL